MKVSLKVKDRIERAAVEAVWANAETQSLMIVLGVLLQLPSDRARRRVMAYLEDCAHDAPTPPVPPTDLLEG